MASRILIVKLSSMGDVVHTLPAAQALRARFPDAHLGWVVEKAHSQLLEGQPFLDALHVWDRKNLRTFASLIRELRRTPWDLAIDFQGLFRSGIVTRLSGAKRRAGYYPVREMAHLFYTERTPLETLEQHAVERYLKLAAAIDAPWPEAAAERPYVDGRAPGQPSAGKKWFPLRPSAAEKNNVEAWLGRHGFDPARERLVILNPHCRKDANRWPAERFSALAMRLLGVQGIRLVLSGAPNTRELCDEIAAPLPAGCVLRADGAFGLLGAVELFSRSAVMVTGDTGPMHLAVAVETPVVALFGPANSLRTGPYARDAIVLDRRLECAPCFAGSRCPLGHVPPRCLAEISVDDVFEAVLQQLVGRRDSAHARPGTLHTIRPPAEELRRRQNTDAQGGSR